MPPFVFFKVLLSRDRLDSFQLELRQLAGVLKSDGYWSIRLVVARWYAAYVFVLACRYELLLTRLHLLLRLFVSILNSARNKFLQTAVLSVISLQSRTLHMNSCHFRCLLLSSLLRLNFHINARRMLDVPPWSFARVAWS